MTDPTPEQVEAARAAYNRPGRMMPNTSDGAQSVRIEAALVAAAAAAPCGQDLVEAIASAICSAAPHPEGGSRVVFEDAEAMARDALAAATSFTPRDSGKCGGCRDLGPHRNVPNCDFYEPPVQAGETKLALHYCPTHGDLIPDADGVAVPFRSPRCQESHSVAEIAAALVASPGVTPPESVEGRDKAGDTDRPTIDLAREIAAWDQGIETTQRIPNWAANLAMHLIDSGYTFAAPARVDEAKLTGMILGRTAPVAARAIAKWLRGGGR